MNTEHDQKPTILPIPKQRKACNSTSNLLSFLTPNALNNLVVYLKPGAKMSNTASFLVSPGINK